MSAPPPPKKPKHTASSTVETILPDIRIVNIRDQEVQRAIDRLADIEATGKAVRVVYELTRDEDMKDAISVANHILAVVKNNKLEVQQGDISYVLAPTENSGKGPVQAVLHRDMELGAGRSVDDYLTILVALTPCTDAGDAESHLVEEPKTQTIGGYIGEHVYMYSGSSAYTGKVDPNNRRRTEAKLQALYPRVVPRLRQYDAVVMPPFVYRKSVANRSGKDRRTLLMLAKRKHTANLFRSTTRKRE